MESQGSITSTRLLPNFLVSVKLKYVKLGYHYLISNALYLLLLPLLFAVSTHLTRLDLTAIDLHHLYDHLRVNLITVVISTTLIVFLSTFYFMTRPRPVYLLDFSCYKPEDARKCPRELFVERSEQAGTFTQENLLFQKKIIERSGLGQDTYFPEAVIRVPPNPCMAEARKEAEMVMFGAIDDLLAKTG